MKKSFKQSSKQSLIALSLLAGTGTLSSCLTLGADKIDNEPTRFELQACADQAPLKRDSDNASWQLKYLGPAQALSTAKAPWGSTLRYVIPYTRHTALFELSVTNRSQDVLWVDPAAIVLERANQQAPSSALALNFFKRAWPSGAVDSESELIDSSLAISEVERTLFVRRPLQPGESYTGIVPFVRFDDPPQTLRITNWQRGESDLTTEFCLSWREKR